MLLDGSGSTPVQQAASKERLHGEHHAGERHAAWCMELLEHVQRLLRTMLKSLRSTVSRHQAADAWLQRERAVGPWR